ncbi:S35B4 protein, partial [Alaudala cheleensis]|nr:S35B4 protein [Alaudala cheleensis]
ASDSSLNQEDGPQAFLWWLLGIAALTFALLMSARMGIFQETLYQKFGKHSKEALFYNRPVPTQQIPGGNPPRPHQASHLPAPPHSQRESPLSISPRRRKTLGVLPCPLLPLAAAPRYVCIRGVFILTTECTSLTVTLVVTLRKFVSLIFSILYFQNPFTAWHWLGTAFVFVGTLMYTEVWNSLLPFLRRRRRPKEE